MGSMDALLSALKRAGGKGSTLPGDDEEGGSAKPIAAKVSVLSAKPVSGADAGLSDDGMSDGNDVEASGDESPGDEDAENQRNSDIVTALQDQYPAIYAKISKGLDQGDSGGAMMSGGDDMPPEGASL